MLHCQLFCQTAGNFENTWKTLGALLRGLLVRMLTMPRDREVLRRELMECFEMSSLSLILWGRSRKSCAREQQKLIAHESAECELHTLACSTEREVASC